MVRRFTRERAWYEYIFKNRAGAPDAHPEEDVIIGPIANDTIYDTMGVITSGFLTPEEALRLLKIGPCFEQAAVKSEKALSHLTWKSSRILSHEEMQRSKEAGSEEQEAYQKLLAEALEEMS